jgi:hypothetical protein
VVGVWVLAGCHPAVNQPATGDEGGKRAAGEAHPGMKMTPAEVKALERAQARRAGWLEPKDLDEAVERLKAARVRLAASGEVRMRYAEEELRALVKGMPIPRERYLVRLVSREVKEPDMLGVPRAFGKLPVWVTTFEQLEDADTDPEVICRMLGLGYDPKLPYYMLVLRDLGADEAARPEMYCPTRQRILSLASRELVNPFFSGANYEDALSPEYDATYRDYMNRLHQQGLREWVQDDVDRFVESVAELRDNSVLQHRFRTRVRVQVQLGATEEFRGDGLTRLVGDQARQVGVQEIFVLDSSPKPIGEYAAKGQLAKVKCGPLERLRPVRFLEPEGEGTGR